MESDFERLCREHKENVDEAMARINACIDLQVKQLEAKRAAERRERSPFRRLWQWATGKS